MNKGLFFKYKGIFFDFLCFTYGDENKVYEFGETWDYIPNLIEFRNRLVQRKNYIWGTEWENHGVSFMAEIIDNDNVKFTIIDHDIYDEEWWDKPSYDPAEYHILSEIMPIEKLVKMFDDFFDELLNSPYFPILYPFQRRTLLIGPKPKHMQYVNFNEPDKLDEIMEECTYEEGDEDRLHKDMMKTVESLMLTPAAERDVELYKKMLRERKYPNEKYDTYWNKDDDEYIRTKCEHIS